MSIATVGSGILNTHVTLADIEEVLKKSTGEVYKFDKNTKIEDVGEGNGLLSKIALITTSWSEPKNTIPEKFIVKIMSMLPQVEIDPSVANRHELHENFRQTHNREIQTYEILWKYKTNGIPIPKIYGSQKFTKENDIKGFIIMEFVDKAVVKPAVQNIELEELDQALEALAEVVAITPKMSDEEKDLFPPDVIGNLCKSFYTTEMISSQLKELRLFVGEKNSALVDELAKELKFSLSPTEFDNLNRLNSILGLEPVLSHGDIWSPNMLWRKNGDKWDLAAIIDFQIANLGTAAADFVTVVCSTLSPELRREHYHDLIENFYDKINSKTESPLFSLIQLELACEWSYPLCAYNAMSSMCSVFPNLNLSRYNTTKVQCVEKCKALAEDIVQSSKRLRQLSSSMS